MAKNIPGNENQRPPTKTTLSRRLSIKIEGKTRSFPDKRRPREYTSTKPTMQEMLKGLLSEDEGVGGTGGQSRKKHLERARKGKEAQKE